MSTNDRNPSDPPAPKDDTVLVLEDLKNLRKDDNLERLVRQASAAERLAAAQERRAAAARQQRLSIDDEEDDDGDVRPYTGPVSPPAKLARARGRHWAVLLSFLLIGVVPVAISGWYLWERAVDRYVSTAAFSVRTEEAGSAFELLGGMVNLGSSSSSDTDILYAFIQSQELVQTVDDRVDLRALWAKGDPERDPVFAYHPPGTIEDMVDYWNRAVKVYNDTGTGLMQIKVLAYTPEDAQMLAEVIYEESSTMINRLSDVAREDVTRYARVELEEAVEQLKTAREAVTLFRNRNQIVDPSSDMQSQIGILSSLQSQLASTLIDLDILRQTTADGDPRIVQAERRVDVINARIADERAKFGIGASSGATEEGDRFAEIVGEYQRLTVDLQFAEQTYAAARAAFDAAVSQSRRQSRYLAAHIRPTLAEKAEYPDRIPLLALVALFSFLAWALIVLVAYALKDRR